MVLFIQISRTDRSRDKIQNSDCQDWGKGEKQGSLSEWQYPGIRVVKYAKISQLHTLKGTILLFKLYLMKEKYVVQKEKLAYVEEKR